MTHRTLLRPVLAALLLGAALVPGTASAARVFFGVGFGVPFAYPYAYPYPYFYRPPVVVAVPPPIYYAPPPAYYAPPAPPLVYGAATPGAGFSARCNAGAYVCPLPTAAPVGNACSCPAGAGRVAGRVG